MQHITASFTNSDRVKIHMEKWLPDNNDPKAIVLIVHGIAEHIGRYQHVAEFLVARGYAVYGLDHRTHGQSGGDPRVYITDFDKQSVGDLKQFFDVVKDEHPNKKIFIYGHSLGSFISTLFVVKYQDQLAGFISSGSPLASDTTVPGYMVMIGNLLNMVAPTMPLIKIAPDGISRDPAVVKDYLNDRLVSKEPVRVRMAIGFNNALAPLRDHLKEIRLPLLVLHGSEDKIAPLGGSEALYREAASPDKVMKIYPGLYHEVHNEPEKETVFKDIIGWLDRH